jgi:phage FluMu protein Com
VTAKFDEQQAVAEREARCECGQLIAKLQQDGIELKCKRCKRIVTISFASIEGWTVPSPSVGSPDKKVSATHLR